MIDATKVRMMTKLASYESGDGKKELKMHRYSKGTYLSLKQLESFFAITLAYALGAFLYCSRYYTEIMTKGLAFDYRQLIMHILLGYIALIVVNLLSHIKEYDKNLFALNSYLEKEELQK